MGTQKICKALGAYNGHTEELSDSWGLLWPRRSAVTLLEPVLATQISYQILGAYVGKPDGLSDSWSLN